MATQGDRSLSAGMLFPKWMKTKPSDKFDVDQGTFSPPELDDSFMYYYRYPKKQETTTSNTVNVNVTESKIVSSAQQVQKISSSSADFSKITENPCKFVGKEDPSKSQVSKSKGTDDGFKGEPATVGSSVIKVAHQMVSGKVVNTDTLPEDQCEQLLAKFDPYRRRGSRSLPASPLTSPGSSPKSKRRVANNKYFTGAFTDSERGKSGWILSNLLAKREISQSVNYINEESKDELDRAASMFSVDETGMTRQQAYKAKPSELREMNFWTPTSM